MHFMSETPFIPRQPGNLGAQDAANSCPVPQTAQEVEEMNLPWPLERIAIFGLTRRLEVDKQRLQYEVDHDKLTGALTREAFQQAIEADQRANSGASRGLIFIDLGNFKAVNALLHHSGGDAILKAVVALFQRGSDLVCRLGGDEFAIYMDTSTDTTSGDPAHTKRTHSGVEELATQVDRVVNVREAIVADHPILNSGPIRFYVAAAGIVYDPRSSYEVNLAAADALSEKSKDEQAGTYGKYREVDLPTEPN